VIGLLHSLPLVVFCLYVGWIIPKFINGFWCSFVNGWAERNWLDSGGDLESFLDRYRGFFTTNRYSISWHFALYLSASYERISIRGAPIIGR